MPLAQSRITSQGQVSVPIEVRKKLGVGPGSVIEWEAHGDGMVVRRAARYCSEDIHAALFAEVGRKPRKIPDVKAASRRHIRSKHAGY